MIAILSRPYKLFEAQESKWVAAGNPIVYEFEVTEIIDPGYWVKVDVLEFGSNKILGSLRHQPIIKSGTGKFKIDVSGVVRSYLSNTYIFDTSELNQKDFQSSIRCFIRYAEFTLDFQMNVADDSANQFFALNAAKQFSNPFGSNVADYVPFAEDNTVKARFLTHFKNPRKYIGYPFTLTVIYSENIAGVDVKKVEEQYDINMNLVYNTEGSLDASQVRAVNNLKVDDTYPSEVRYLKMWLETGEPNSDLYVDEGYVDDDYTLGGLV